VSIISCCVSGGVSGLMVIFFCGGGGGGGRGWMAMSESKGMKQKREGKKC
jgi:hypothetical protein